MASEKRKILKMLLENKICNKCKFSKLLVPINKLYSTYIDCPDKSRINTCKKWVEDDI